MGACSIFLWFISQHDVWNLTWWLVSRFTDYQTLCDDDFADVACEKTKVSEWLKDDDGENLFYYGMDVLWYYTANMKTAGSNARRFKLLSKIAEVVLIIPHSNAELERLFSLVKKKKSLERSSMKLDGKLSSILAMKTKYPESSTPCYHWKPTEDILKTSKKAAIHYNKEQK